MRLIIFGPPGAGKGTQADLLQKEYNIPHLSTGEIFRTAIKNETDLGQKISAILNAGELVPDQIVIELVKNRLRNPAYKKGYILDGVPRTVGQATAYDAFLEANSQKLDAFLLLKVPEQELINRILSRGEGRSDDTNKKIRKRLEVYQNETKPVKDHYEEQGLLREIDGVGSIEEIFERIKLTLEG